MQEELAGFLLAKRNTFGGFLFLLVVKCAPLLKGLKPACAVSVREEQCAEVLAAFQSAQISCRVLAHLRGRALVYLYCEEMLKSYILDRGAADFLLAYGYLENDIGAALERLSGRISGYAAGECGFPHEMGIFLGYPVEDVRGFIVHGGKEFLLSGYWKVYENPAQAQELFRTYDQAKLSAVNEYAEGKTIGDIQSPLRDRYAFYDKL